MPMYGNPRDDITSSLMNPATNPNPTAFDYGLSGGAGAMQQFPMTGPTLAGLPQTPAGGVPGAGIAAAPPSNVQLPPQRMGMQGAMPMMGGLGMAPGMQGMPQMGQQRRRPGMPYA